MSHSYHHLLRVKLFALYANILKIYTKASQAGEGDICNTVSVLFTGCSAYLIFREKGLYFHGSLLLHHPCSFYKRTCSQQLAKQTQALSNTLTRLNETASGDLCTLTGWWAWVYEVCVCRGWMGAGNRMDSLESSSICSPDCNRRLWLLGLYYKI